MGDTEIAVPAPSASGDSFTCPTYATDEKSKVGQIRVILGIKGLRTTRQLTHKGLRPKMIVKAENAEVASIFENRSFCVTIKGNKGDIKHKRWQLNIKQLPGDIIPEKCSTEPDKDRLLLFLAKREDKSWYPELDSGLETAEEEEMDEGS